MYIYILAFFLSTSLFYISTKFKEKKIIQVLLIILALLIPCLLAGMRSEKIGTDVNVYVKPLFKCAKKAKDIKEFYSLGWPLAWRIKKVSEYEYGFSFLVYIVTKVFGNLQAVLFFIQMLTVVPVYLALRKYEKFKDKIWLGMLVYYFVFFSFSLNAMRQMIGVSIVFYAYSILINGKKKDLLFALLIVISFLFHKSSIIGALLYIPYMLIIYQDKINIKIAIGKYRISLFEVLIAVFTIIAMVLVLKKDILIALLNLVGLQKYSGYLSEDISISRLQMAVHIPLLYFYITQFKNMITFDKKYIIFLVLFILDLLASNLSSAGLYASRIGVIFNFFIIISLVVLSSVSKNSKVNLFNNICVVCYCIAYWYLVYVYLGSCQVYPYEFY